MTLEELKQKMDELGLQIPPKPTKGLLARMIRDLTKSAEEEVVVCFGRYRNHTSKEVPEGYLCWAISKVSEKYQRVDGPPQAGELCKGEAEPPRDGGPRAECDGEVRPLRDGPQERRLLVEVVSSLSGRSDNGWVTPMNQDIPPEALEELKTVWRMLNLPMSHVHHNAATDETFQDCFEGHAEVAKDVESLAKELLKVGDEWNWPGGGTRGLHSWSRYTYNLKYTLRYINKFMRKGPKEDGIGLNTQPGIHRDAHNINYNQTIVIGHRGGRLWIDDPNDEINGEPRCVKINNGRNISEKFVENADKVFAFDPQPRHFAEDWDGIRVTITVYTVIGSDALGTEEGDLLRSRGFPMTARRQDLQLR
ncbi:hypothetical protein AK812_SmicGene39713 [Symbiodinium microadriaticum]|uniref:Uncharacterized protein n=1 Tax=Symbiodinium microadriaticum TaxID=2951 RepID=A0A1Q9CAH9_SYMMI|nr:hypothetical protein AK812_SmicGene39713 [Symbiodinium microadriaticum]CAE7880913.1 unnamed protein product [Symbiodinium microadriaticum]CAE7948666.1 unnamed protein product [Symbiodinium sp. KB8]